ncbi:MAG: Lrp/AsnC family transcriptional regulator [Nanoarchaeota archaeon]
MIIKKDLHMISRLRQNARITLTEMSKATKIPISTLYDKLKGYQGNVITRHTTLIDFTRLGYHARTALLIKVGTDDRESLKEYLMKHPSINSVFRINNGYDFFVEGIFHHLVDVEGFIANIEKRFKTERIENHYVVEDIKKEAFLSDAYMLEMI